MMVMVIKYKKKQEKCKIKRGKICPAAIIRMRESGFPGPDVEELSDPHCCFAATQKSKEQINKRNTRCHTRISLLQHKNLGEKEEDTTMQIQKYK